MKRWHALVSAIGFAAVATPAAAQFTGVVVPPKSKAQLQAAAARADSAVTRRDSALAARLTDMKKWVDSAAVAVAAQPRAVAGDSSARVDTTRARSDTASARGKVSTAASAGEVTSFREGAPAPNTASPLPLIALLGAGSLLTGAWLRRR
jgi:hypothetical protein